MESVFALVIFVVTVVVSSPGVTVGGPCGSPTIAPQSPHSEQGQAVE